MLKKLSDSTIFRVASLMAVISVTAIVSLVSSVYLSDTFESETRLISYASSASQAVLRIDVSDSQELQQIQVEEFMENWALLEPLQRNSLMNWVVREQVYQLDQSISQLGWRDTEPETGEQIHNRPDLDSIHAGLVVLHSALFKKSEETASLLRLIQSFALFVTVLVVTFSLLIVRRDVEQPLTELTDAALRISKGDYNHPVTVRGRGELATLASAISEMQLAIRDSQYELSYRVSEKTKKLKRANDALKLLYDMTVFFAQSKDEYPRLDLFLSRMTSIVLVDHVDICLVTEAGAKPYEHYEVGKVTGANTCESSSCAKCTSEQFLQVNRTVEEGYRSQFPIRSLESRFGVITATSSAPLAKWQQHQLRSIAASLANGLELRVERKHARRIALLKERAVIARELHDSLAQALTYLRIQVVRMDKALPEDRSEHQQGILNELDSGLTSAYKELRELLTTFRLKIEGQTIEQALRETIDRLLEKNSDIRVSLDYTISQVPLTPQEEINLLQIAREAVQNAFYHSNGSLIKVELTLDELNHIVLSVADNGQGTDTSLEKLNHYGMAIMKERSRVLGGRIDLDTAEGKGTVIKLRFKPAAMISADRLPVSNL